MCELGECIGAISEVLINTKTGAQVDNTQIGLVECFILIGQSLNSEVCYSWIITR